MFLSSLNTSIQEQNVPQTKPNEIELSTVNTKTSEPSQLQPAYQPKLSPHPSSCLDTFTSNLSNSFTNLLSYFGPFFSISIICFIFFTYIATLKTIFPYYNSTHPYFTLPCLKLVITFQLFYVLTNFLLATLIKPGSLSDLQSSYYYKNNNAYYTSVLSFPKKPPHITTISWKTCKHCNTIKPLRTHHCSVCNRCVMKMDHHCAWINNCVGQNNQRYFLLFITHLFMYCIVIATLALPMIVNGYFRKIEDEFKLICVLSISGVVMLTFFNYWNWFLALNGATTIEYWESRLSESNGKGVCEFSFGNWRDNLFYIFGSRSVFRILFVPSVTRLPFSGLEWSKYYDKDFMVDGIEMIATPLAYNEVNTEDVESLEE